MLLLTIVSFSEVLYATVGGPQLLKFLGHKENSLYFIYEYHDERVNPPELWRYDISDDSLYISSDWINYPEESIDEALKRNDLDMRQLPDTIAAHGQIDFDYGHPVERYMESMDIFYDLYPVNVKWEDETFKIYQCYDRIERPKVHKAYTFQDLDISLAIIRYKGICFETGYLKDTLLIKSYQEDAFAEPQSEETDKDYQDQLPLIISLVFLSAVLMLIILFRKKRK